MVSGKSMHLNYIAFNEKNEKRIQISDGRRRWRRGGDDKLNRGRDVAALSR